MTVSIIVAVSRNGVIGKQGGLPWHLPAEMAHFKEVTMGHPIIMGRKTHESIGRALPGRQNIVITRDPDFNAEGCDVVHSLDQALKTAKNTYEVFVIGGDSIYQQALPLADRIYLTRVDTDVDGDKYFRFDSSKWQSTKTQKHPADNKNMYDYEFDLLVRK